MTNRNITLSGIIACMIMVTGIPAFSQETVCKVTIEGISEIYSGECKNGLAHGKGIAQGTDHYEGHFIRGKPEGKGRYTWADGSYYEGQWKEGLREGKGKMVKGDSILTGYWVAGKYAGEKLEAPYKILSILSVTRYTINKVSNEGHELRIKIVQGGMDNTTIEELSMTYDSGSEFKMGNTLGLQNINFPVEVKMRYRTWNQLHTTQYEVVFEFRILQPGTWNVMISN